MTGQRRDYVETAVVVSIVTLAALTVVGQFLGYPVALSVVETDSMEPTLEAGDGFLAVPSIASGDVETGDVVVFRAQELHDGGLTTHRVVAVTDEGYVTKGDANPFTDQDASEPPITDDQIVATALQIDGSVVTIPGVGAVVWTLRDAAEWILGAVGVERPGARLVGGLLFAVGTTLFALSFVGEFDRTRSRDRSRERSRDRSVQFDVRVLVVVFALLVLVPTNAAMLLPAGSYAVDVQAEESPPDDAQIVAPGDASTIELPTHNDGLVPVLVAVDAPAPEATVENGRTVVTHGERDGAVLTAKAPDEPGIRTYTVIERRYPVVLPPSTLEALHGGSPVAAWGAVNLVLLAPIVAVARCVGTRPLRIRSRGGASAGSDP